MINTMQSEAIYFSCKNTCCAIKYMYHDYCILLKKKNFSQNQKRTAP